jgi:hypothetical protein
MTQIPGTNPDQYSRIHHQTIWLAHGGVVRRVLSSRDPAVGFPGFEFDQLTGRLAAGGNAAFAYEGEVRDATEPAQYQQRKTERGVWFHDGRALKLIARRNMPMPGVPGVVANVYGDTMSIDADGRLTALAFTAPVNQPPGTGNTDSPIALLAWSNDQWSLVWMHGQPLPNLRGLPAGVTAAPPQKRAEGGGRAGRLEHVVKLAGAGVTQANDQALALYSPRDQGWRIVARTGEPIDGLQGGEVLRELKSGSTPNAQGQFLLHATVGAPKAKPGTREAWFVATFPADTP